MSQNDDNEQHVSGNLIEYQRWSAYSLFRIQRVPSEYKFPSARIVKHVDTVRRSVHNFS